MGGRPFGVRASVLVLAAGLGLPPAVRAILIPGGGPKRTDCIAQLSSTGAGFPAGRRLPLGVTCTDGEACDQDGERNGVCVFAASICINMTDDALPRCTGAQVKRIRLKGKRTTKPKGKADLSPLEAAAGALGFPSAAAACSTPVEIPVGVTGPNKQGQFDRGQLRIRLKAPTVGGPTDADQFRLVCLPGASPIPPDSPPPPPPPPVRGTPGAGLRAAIESATIAASGTVQVTFTLTDDAGVAIDPMLAATSDPNLARVRFTLARLDVVAETAEGFTTEFTRYRNYITATQTAPGGASSDQPTYDTGGSFALADAETGTWVYTFGTVLPAGFPANRTHTIGAQIERTFAGERLIANPLLDFVPDGSAVTTIRELTTTMECNACHGRLEVHGGARREVQLCQLCHTDQAVDPDTGNTIDFKVMIHKIHRGSELPSLQEAVGSKYSIVGFNRMEFVYGKRVRFCDGGPKPLTECETDDDCEPVGTCVDIAGSTIKTVGVRFPRDVRDCVVCHTQGATAANHQERPSAAVCQACHDDANPGLVAIRGIAPGTNHVPGPQPDAFCRLCHVPTGPEFGISVGGAHTIPTHSTQLEGLQGDITAVTGPGGAPPAAGDPLRITFRVTNDAGTPLDVQALGAGATVRFNLAGPNTDFAIAPIAQTAVGGGASGTLSAFDGTGVYTYDTATTVPMGASGTWRIGLEIRRSVNLQRATCRGGAREYLDCTVDADCPDGSCTEPVQEGMQNPVFDFRIGGGMPEPRRTVVETARCQQCHGVFSRGFSVHGQNRATTEYCVVCHNPTQTDFARRRSAVSGAAANGGDPDTETINFKHLIHRLHTGEEQQTKPYVVYGFGQPFTPHDFSDIRFPNDRRRCDACHVNDSHLLPLPDTLLPTLLTRVDTSTMPVSEVTTGTIPPVQDACLSCHDGAAAKAHAETQTTAAGGEACAVCHAEGRTEAVSAAHAID